MEGGGMNTLTDSVRDAYTLVVDFATGIDGYPQGLTVTELEWAFFARHKVRLSERTARAVRRICAFGLTRRCDITGEPVLPLLPRYADGRFPSMPPKRRPAAAQCRKGAEPGHAVLCRALSAWDGRHS
jgi:hypothetical protein